MKGEGGMSGKGGGSSGGKGIGTAEAQKVLSAATKLADEVAAQTSDSGKKAKTIKDATKQAVLPLIATGDPAAVLQYIKGHKKEFVSGVYMTCFMGEVRKQLTGCPTGAAGAVSAANGGKPAETGAKAERTGRVPGEREAPEPPKKKARKG